VLNLFMCDSLDTGILYAHTKVEQFVPIKEPPLNMGRKNTTEKKVSDFHSLCLH
jgi:hypothetical protein